MTCLLLHAAVGGLYFFIGNVPTDAKDAESHFLGLSQTLFINNNANLTGGAIFTNSPNALGACCNCSTLRVESSPKERLKRVIDIKKNSTKRVSEDINVFDICQTENVADRHGGGDNVATTETSVKLCNVGTDKCAFKDDFPMLLNHTSGEDLQEINITLLDIFNKPALGQPETQLKIKANRADVFLTGQLSVDLSHATSLTDVQVRGPVNSTHNLTLSFVPHILSSINIEVEIRGCLAGEIEDRDHKGCTPCGTNLYSFYRNQTCMPCPENAQCSPSTITPEVGFWHSTSKSAQMHECIVEDACSWISRTRDLEEVAMEAHKKEAVLLYDNATYKQCANVSIQLT